MAMRKVFYGPEGIMLNHILRLYDKQSLLNYAGDLQIRRVSGLKKDELAYKFFWVIIIVLIVGCILVTLIVLIFGKKISKTENDYLKFRIHLLLFKYYL